MQRQVDDAVTVLTDSERIAGAPPSSEADLRAAFEREYARAVAEGEAGRTVTPAEQITRAARATGRRPRPAPYLAALQRAVNEMPFQIAPEALRVLDELRADGYGLGVISNTIGEPGECFRPVLRRMGFDHRVELYMFSDEHPWTKPSPELFRLALHRLGSSAADAVHVGDGWSDIEGARRAGMRSEILYTGLQRYGERYRALFFRTGRETAGPTHRVASLLEVPPIVAAELPGAGPR